MEEPVKRVTVYGFTFSMLLMTFLFTNSAMAATIYVNQSAPGPAHDGLSWQTAFISVQPAINSATSGDEIWVARGVYRGCISTKDGVALFGGFSGTETSRDSRDWIANVSTLDGEMAGSVVTIPVGAGLATRIDGFRIQNGSGTPVSVYMAGGGIISYGASPTITNNMIVNNNVGSNGYGGGIFFYASNGAVVTSNIITSNIAYCGGGIWSEGYAGPGIFVSGNTITNNSASKSGGGIYCLRDNPTISGNVISGNRSFNDGGGLMIFETNGVIEHNSIRENVSSGGGGGAIYVGYTHPRIRWNSIERNSSGIACIESTSLIANNRISNNNGSGVATINGDSSTIVGNLFWQNGINLVGSAHVINNTIVNTTAGAGISIEYGSPVVKNNIIAFGFSGIFAVAGTTPVLGNNDVYGNTSYNYSGIVPASSDISVDPALMNLANGDVHLLASSPCVNSGDDSFIAGGWSGLDGSLRIQSDHIDIGAEESPFTDTFKPIVVATDPVNSATGVPFGKTITITFNEIIQKGLNFTGISLAPSGKPAVAITTSISDHVLTIRPNSSLTKGTKYTVTIPLDAVKDANGNPNADVNTLSFTTTR